MVENKLKELDDGWVNWSANTSQPPAQQPTQKHPVDKAGQRWEARMKEEMDGERRMAE